MPVSNTKSRGTGQTSSGPQGLPRFVARGKMFAHRLTDGLVTFYRGVGDGLRLMGHYEALRRLPKDELARRGLTRGDIGQAALRKLRREG
jgi:hypothetical protein